MMNFKACRRAAALLIIFGVAAIAPPAFAQSPLACLPGLTCPTSPPRSEGAVTRYEETDASVKYSGGWVQRNPNDWVAWSGGSVVESVVPGARATFTFTGTAVTWIGCRKSTTGNARVFLDGVFVAEIDTYAAPPAEGYQTTVLQLTGLASGGRTLTIEAIGRKNPTAESAYVMVDAFDVRP